MWGESFRCVQVRVEWVFGVTFVPPWNVISCDLSLLNSLLWVKLRSIINLRNKLSRNRTEEPAVFLKTSETLSCPRSQSPRGSSVWNCDIISWRRQLQGELLMLPSSADWSEDKKESVTFCIYFKIHFQRGVVKPSNWLLCFFSGDMRSWLVWERRNQTHEETLREREVSRSSILVVCWLKWASLCCSLQSILILLLVF